MGIYGKYSKMVTVLSFIQISVGVLMFALGIAFRLLVCSWITDASFGFWVGVLVFIGGIIGYCSATKDNYSFIGYYLCFNSFSIIFAFLVIFCHSLASVHFIHQIQTLNETSPVNSTNTSAINATTTPMPTTKPTTKPTTARPTTNGNSSVDATSITPNSTTTVSVSHSTTRAGPTGPTGPRCYTHQTWNDYENGMRGMTMGAAMIFLCLVEVLLSILSTACCWAATKVQPTGVPREKATIQGTVSEMLAPQNIEMYARRRHGGTVVSRTFNSYDNRYSSPCAADENETVQDNVYETVRDNNVYETVPHTSTSAQPPDGPISNWYFTTAC